MPGSDPPTSFVVLYLNRYQFKLKYSNIFTRHFGGLLPGMRSDGIIIDFDYTLFDTLAFKNALAASLKDLGIGNKDFWRTYSEIRREKETGYSPTKHLDALSAIAGFDRKKAEDKLNKTVLNSGRYLYPDALTFLEELSRISPLLLLSKGDPDFQKRKIAACKIQTYFAAIELTDKEKNYCLGVLTGKYGHNLFFVNDDIRETKEAVREFPNIRPVIKRRDDKPAQDYLQESTPNFNTLNEIKEFILTQYGK